MVDVVQTIAVVLSVGIAALAVLRTEQDRQRSEQRRRLERVLDAVLELNEAAIGNLGVSGRDTEIAVPRAKLAAVLKLAGVPLHQSDLMTRGETVPHERIPAQTEAALLELADAFRAVD